MTFFLNRPTIVVGSLAFFCNIFNASVHMKLSLYDHCYFITLFPTHDDDDVITKELTIAYGSLYAVLMIKKYEKLDIVAIAVYVVCYN